MEIITLLGTVSENCEVRTDRKGNPLVDSRVYFSHRGKRFSRNIETLIKLES